MSKVKAWAEPVVIPTYGCGEPNPNPYDGEPHYNLGLDLKMQGDADKAAAFFTVSLPDFLVFDVDLVEQNKIHCHYMRGLGQLGLQQKDAAVSAFAEALKLAPFHLGAQIHNAMLKQA